MKKLTVLVLCLLLLLSGCAVQGGAASGGELRDLYISGGESDDLDLTGLRVRMEAADADGSAGVRIRFDTGGDMQGDVIAALVGETVLLQLEDTVDGTHTYALENVDLADMLDSALADILGKDMAQLEQDLSGEDAELTDEQIEAALAALEAADLSPEEQAEMDASAEQLDEIQRIVEQCVTLGESRQIGGVRYETVDLDLDSDAVAAILDLIQVPEMGETATVGQLLADSGITMSLTGQASGAVTEEPVRFLLDLHPVLTVAGDGVYTVDFTVDQTADDGSMVFSLEAYQDSERQGAFAITYAPVAVDSADWLPTEVDPEATVLTDMDFQQAMELLAEDFSDFFGQVSGAVMGLALTNRVLNGLDWAW